MATVTPGETPKRTMPAMLPDGFYWAPRSHLDEAPNAIFHAGHVVAYVDGCVGGGWIARLDVQRPFDSRLVTRRCASLETGRRGCELWVSRHEARLRREVADQEARLACKRWAARC